MKSGFVNRLQPLSPPFPCLFCRSPHGLGHPLAGTRKRCPGRLLAAFLALAFPGRLKAALAAFLAPPAAFLAGFEAFRLAPLPAGLAAFLGVFGSIAPIAARMRSISWVTCSMVIMPSTVSNFRRSE